MNRWVCTTFIITLCVASILGCSGSGDLDPVIPGIGQSGNDNTPLLTSERNSGRSDSSLEVMNYLWGWFDVYVDAENEEIEAVLNRSAMFNANVVQFLNGNPLGFTFVFKNIKQTSSYVDVDIDVSIKHPLGLPKFNGYDVRCIFIADGSTTLQTNGLQVQNPSVDQHMRDDPTGDGGGPDGYTRWFNPTEFGVPGLLGYTKGSKAFMTDFSNSATLCPYKYYSDTLAADDEYIPWIKNYPETNGVFTAGWKNTRNFYIRFPNAKPLEFAYAVVASWAGGAPEFHPANTVEAVACDVTNNSTLWYKNETLNGGLIDLGLKFYGWGEQLSAVMLESSVLSVPMTIEGPDLVKTGSGANWHSYHVQVFADNVTGLSDNEIWVMAVYNAHDYSNSFGVPNSADGPLISYFRFPLSVSSNPPPCDDPPEIVNDNIPTGYVGQEYSLTFEAIGGDGNLTWSLEPGSVLPDGLNFSEEGVLSGIPAEGSNDLYPDIVFKVEDSCLAGQQSDSVSLGMIVLDPSITVVAPNGGENYVVGSDHEIKWTSVELYTYVDIYYSKDYFNMDHQLIASDEENDGSFWWYGIPPDPSDFATVRVISSDLPHVYDDSDSEFTISGASITVLDPNGGENLSIESSYEILWETENIVGPINIWYSKDNFVSDWNPIVQFTENSGSFMWDPIPDDPSTTVKVRVELGTDPLYYDVSDANFTISAVPLGVVYPNGGEEFWFGTTETIEWTTGGVTGNVDIYYSKDGFVSDVNTIIENAPNSGLYDWEDVPMDFTESAKVRVRSHDVPGFYDDSDGPFSIVDHGWAKTWGETTNDACNAVIADDTGNVFIAGADGNHAMLAKFDKYGTLLWQKEWGNAAGDKAVDLDMDGSGNIYLVGVFSDAGAVDFDPGPGQDLHTMNGVQDIFLVCYNSSGTYQWGKQIGGSNADFVNGIAVKSDGVCYVVGEFSGTVDFDPDGTVSNLTASGYSDAYLAVYESNGTYNWAGRWGSNGATANDFDNATDVCLGQDTIYITGAFDNASAVDFNPGAGEFLLTSNGGHDSYLSVFTIDQNFEITYSWGGTGELDGGYGMAVDLSGNIYVCGQMYGVNVDMNPTGGTDLQSSTGTNGNSFVTKFNASEIYQWSKHWGGGPSASDDDVAYSVAAGPDLSVFVAGEFSDTVDFDPGAGENVHSTTSWPTDGYVTKFDSSGNHILANTMGGSSFDGAYGVAVTGTGYAYVVGGWQSNTSEFAPNDGSCGIYSDVHTKAGGSDCFLVKYMEDGCW